jgi:hypothetical protein
MRTNITTGSYGSEPQLNYDNPLNQNIYFIKHTSSIKSQFIRLKERPPLIPESNQPTTKPFNPKQVGVGFHKNG